LETVNSLSVYEDNFLFFLRRQNRNELYLFSMKNSDYNQDSNINNPIKFRSPENVEDIEIDEFIFNNNSEDFYIISGYSAYKNKKGLLLANEGYVTVERISKSPVIFSEDESGDYTIVEDDLYYLNFENNSKNIQFYNISNSDAEILTFQSNLSNIDYDVSSIELNYDPQNKKIFALLKSEKKNYLYTFIKTDGGYEDINSMLIENENTLPDIILVDNFQNNGEVLISFKDNSLTSYDQNLQFLNNYIIIEQNNGFLTINDALINDGRLYILDNNNNIFTAELQ